MSKYGNRKTMTMDGVLHDSQKEANRWAELKLLERVGLIKDLRRQVEYELIPAQYIDGKCVERAVKYKADFVYHSVDLNKMVVEDTKGMRTKDYIIKRKLMLWVHRIRIKEI